MSENDLALEITDERLHTMEETVIAHEKADYTKGTLATTGRTET